jgi:hypothetical protein
VYVFSVPLDVNVEGKQLRVRCGEFGSETTITSWQTIPR